MGARILETVENYVRVEAKPGAHAGWSPRAVDFLGDEYFWFEALHGNAPFGSQVLFFDKVAISEWVPRVPGLFWTNSAAKLRECGKERVEHRTGTSLVLTPFGKSQLVSGGVGTLRLPPSAHGDRIATVIMTGNVSAGVPILISEEVWAQAQLREGSVVEIQGAVWQAMDTTWASQFPSTRGIPRGYLRIDDPRSVRATAETVATEVHPFSIMEYASDNVELFDFVYATAVTGERPFRQDIERFFDHYRQAEGRNGRYLIAADIAEPMWDSEFTSPAELRRSGAHYDILLRRINDSINGSTSTDDLLRILCKTDVDLLKRFSADIGIPHSLWFHGGSLAGESANLLDRLPADKTGQLLDAIAAVNPHYLEA
jgi:hypothetical protein